MASITESMDDMGDANVRLQFLFEQIRDARTMTTEQHAEIKELRRTISRAASKIPQLVGNKSVIIP